MKTLIVTERLPPQFYFNLREPVRGTERFYHHTAYEAGRYGEVDVEMDGVVEPFVAMPNVTVQPRRNVRSFYDRILVCNPRDVDESLGRSYSTQFVVWHDFHFGIEKRNYRVLNQIAAHFGTVPTVISHYSRNEHPADEPLPRVVYLGRPNSSAWLRPKSVPGCRSKTVAFTSSPDRGLAELQRFWAERNIEAATGYKLWHSGYGRFTDEQLAYQLRAAAFWIHPGLGNELFCLAAVEAQLCGATPLVVPNGGLAETVKYGYCFTRKSFFDGVEAVLHGEATMDGVNADHIPQWQDVTEELLYLK